MTFAFEAGKVAAISDAIKAGNTSNAKEQKMWEHLMYLWKNNNELIQKYDMKKHPECATQGHGIKSRLHTEFTLLQHMKDLLNHVIKQKWHE